jgi:serine phosphatase RsbU (regulator of sigma subunit)
MSLSAQAVPSKPSPRLWPFFVAGVAACALGLVLARQELPEWNAGQIPGRAAVLARIAEVLAASPFDVVPDSARVHLASSNDETFIAHQILGPQALAWRQQRGTPFYLTAQGNVTLEDGPAGYIEVLFSRELAVWQVTWVPTALTSFLPSDSAADQLLELTSDFADLILLPGESLGDPSRMVISGSPVTALPILESATPEHLIATNQGTVVRALRRPGTIEQAQEVIRYFSFNRLFLRLLVPAALVLLTLGLFLRLALQQRIDFKNAALIAAPLAVLNLQFTLSYGMDGWFYLVQILLGPLLSTLAFFVLWSVAESWHRTSRPGIVNQLDWLRRGRLGPGVGQALLGGFALGLVLAGLRLALPALVARFGLATLAGNSIGLPAGWFAIAELRSGLYLAGISLLLAALSHRWLPARWAPWVMGVLVALTAESLLTGFWSSVALNLAPAAVVVVAHRRWNITGLLVTCVVGWVLPAAVFSVVHVDWMMTTLLTSMALLATPLVVGVIALRAAPLEDDYQAVAPTFVRRIETQRRLGYEMDLLARMQRGLLPAALPQIDGYQIAARSLLASEAGGDLYHFHQEPNRLWVAAGDVAGHGYSCAIAQAMTKAALLSVLKHHSSPAEVLGELDGVLRAGGIERHFTSLALLCLELDSGEARLSNAGYPYPFLMTSDTIEEIVLPSLPLGQGPYRRYQDRAVRLSPGSVLLFYSDGFFEATSPAGVPYGFDRPRAVLQNGIAFGAPALLTALFADWRRHLGSSVAGDDTTLVVLRRES